MFPCWTKGVATSKIAAVHFHDIKDVTYITNISEKIFLLFCKHLVVSNEWYSFDIDVQVHDQCLKILEKLNTSLMSGKWTP